MKKRISFVDDEALVLQGLQRMLRPLREEWDMEFFESGAAALSRMAVAPFDVVVSDLRMPGMNGAEFLSAVREHHPKTIRLILSGHADQELAVQGFRSAHQCLAKPCDPAALKAVMSRASALEDALHSAPLRQLVAQLTQLPSLPALYVQIVAIAERPEASLDEVAQVIARDAGMTARILRIVNSAFFGFPREFSSTEEAIAHLGLDLVKALVLSIDASTQLGSMTTRPASMGSSWAHSLSVAARAKLIAQLEHSDRATVSHAFTAGILHEIGKLVLAVNLPNDYAQVIRLIESEACEAGVAEERIFGASHAEVGGYLLGLWGLPAPMVEAVALHLRPMPAAPTGFSPLTAVHVANACTSDEAAQDVRHSRLDQAYLAAAGVLGRLPTWRAAFNAREPASLSL